LRSAYFAVVYVSSAMVRGMSPPSAKNIPYFWRAATIAKAASEIGVSVSEVWGSKLAFSLKRVPYIIALGSVLLGPPA